MASVVPIAITVLPTPPSTANPVNFDSLANAFLGAFPTLRTDINRETSTTYTNAVESKTQADAASASALAASNSQTAANASANTASITGVKWAIGTSFAEGATAWSPITFHTYRRKAAGSGGADPSENTATWVQITGNPYSFVNLDILY